LRDISLHLLDIIQNSVKAEATSISIMISADEATDRLKVIVTDNGCGMDADFLKKVTDPFTTTRKTRKVGLGIPLLKESCEMTGGNLEIISTIGAGTRLEADFIISSIDRIPIGNIGDTFFSLTLDRPEIDYRIDFIHGDNKFTLDYSDIRKQLDDVPLNELSICTWIKESIEEEKINIFGGILNEIVS
jgi:hypothetical protein